MRNAFLVVLTDKQKQEAEGVLNRYYTWLMSGKPWREPTIEECYDHYVQEILRNFSPTQSHNFSVCAGDCGACNHHCETDEVLFV